MLQRNQGEESPFIEFIQRVCSECKDKEGKCLPIKPGCGGFGIRNFLTLFLSIELSKSMNQIVEAAEKGDAAMEHVARRQVQLFTQQLDESNPILTKSFLSKKVCDTGKRYAIKDRLSNLTYLNVEKSR